MNELLNHLNNYAKKRKNKHRFSAVMVCLAVIVSFTVYIGLIEPAESASGQLACGMEEHEHTQDCFELICGFDEETEEEIVVETTVSDSEETTETTCETEETTTEKTETTTSTEAEETAPVHVHSDKCYRLICLTEAHLHKQDCYNQPVETTEPAATTETSASISTGTTMSTEQTTETTTELSEEVYELNAALFGELYMDRVSVLADAVALSEYKFYYINGVLNAHSCFSYPDNATGNPNNNSIKRTYNGIEYKMAYSFEKNAENERYITLKAPTNGTWILLFGDVEKTFNINIKYNDNVVKSQLFNDTSNGIMVVPVESGKTYKAYQNTDDESKARLVYAEFVPTVTPTANGIYGIRNVHSGLYVTADERITQNIATNSDARNSFKFIASDDYYYIQSMLDEDVIDYFSSESQYGRYDKGDNKDNQQFKLSVNPDGTYKVLTKDSQDKQCWQIIADNNDATLAVGLKMNKQNISRDGDNNSTNTAQDFIFVKAPEVVATFNTEKVYTIQNNKSKNYISYSDNYDNENFDFIQVAAASYNDSDNNFKFKFEDAGDGYYYIRVLADGLNDNYLQAYYRTSDARYLKVASKETSSDEQKFKVIDNLNGTYTIHFATGVIDASTSGGAVKTWSLKTEENQQFLIAETSYTPPEIVYQKAEIDPNTTYLIKNVRSRLYVHNDDGNIVQQKDVGVESQFRFENKGDGKYYIHLPAADEWMTIGVENIENEADVKLSWSNNAFYAEKMENGSVRFYQENNGKKYYLGINGESTNSGAIVNLWDADEVNDHQCFFLVPVIEPVEVPEANTRVEARVIFADYNDGKIDDNTRNLYDEPAWTPTIELYKGNESNPIYTEKGNLVIDVSEARKDWCYQYNYVWNLGTDTTNEYTVKLNGVNSGNKITLNGKEFNVYYLKDTELNHPGNNGNSNAPAEAYKQTPYSQAGDQIIYIFLDPVVEQWWGGTNPPGTFDLSMKKRWDGHNSDGFDNRKKEKIQIQLQRLVTENGVEKWVEYNPADLGENYRSIIYYEKNNISNNFVDKTFTYNNVPLVSADVPEDQRLTRVVPGVEEEVAWQTPDDKYVNKTVLEQAQGAKDGATVDKANRLELVLDYKEWNNVILSYDKGNKPSHFQEGYYMNWKALPYGNYRVIETMSFYDANENDVFDEGDRDTSNEYYYMSYPPMRDSRGVLHIQNFTKDMVLDIQKEWYDDQGTEKMDNPGKTVKVNIYRSLEKLSDPSIAKLGVPIYSDVEVTGDNVILKTTAGYDKLLLKTTSEKKYYYYIQEVSVDGYLLLNGNDEGFVKSTNGNYYVDYEDGDGRKFIITNKAKIGLRVEKEWYNNSVSDENKIDYYNNNTDNPIYPKFKIYKGDRPGTPVVNYDICSVNGVALEKIAEVTIGKDGYFELVSDEHDKHGDSSYVNDELNMLSDTKYELVSTGFDGNIFRNASDHPANIQGDYIVVDNTNRFWVGSNKTKNNQVEAPYITGTLTLEFENYDENSILSVGNRCTINGNVSNEAKYYNIKDANGVVSIPGLYVDGNYRIMGNNCTLNIKKVTFTHDAYYYIQEITNDNSNYTLSNGDSNGFVKIGDNFYTTITANNRYPVVTAQNIPKVNLDITKEWTSSNAEISKVMDFEIYKAFAQGTPVADGEGYKVTVNNADYQLTKIDGTYKTNGEGNLDITNLPAFEEKDGTYHKLYYYVREIEGNYNTSDAINGFIPYESGQYGTAFDDTSSNSGKYNFVNTLKLEITVEKTWLREDKEVDLNKASMQMNFRLYRTTNTTNDPNSDYLVGEYVTENRTKLIQNLDAYDSSGKKYNYYIVEISSDGNYSVDNYIVTYSETNVSWNKDGKQPVINVTNQAKPQNYELPETGGIGTHGYTVTGGAIILLSAMILLFKRRTQL